MLYKGTIEYTTAEQENSKTGTEYTQFFDTYSIDLELGQVNEVGAVKIDLNWPQNWMTRCQNTQM